MIGLLTPFMVSNYGTKLQAYAVQQCIAQLGLEGEIVNCAPRGEKLRASNFLYKCVNRLIRMKYADRRNVTQCSDEIEKQRALRRKAINAFDAGYLKLSEEIASREALERYAAENYDTVVCGSDQIWNPYNIGPNFYLLEWTEDNVSRIAFSPSFGVDRVPWILRRKYIRELKRFDGLSVREEAGLRILNDLGFHDALHTVDPTLAADAQVWHELAARAEEIVTGRYVLCYFLGGLDFGREAAKAIAGRLGIKIANLPHLGGFCEADEKLRAEHDVYEAGVPEFVRLIRDAEFIVTDSFHATVFSVIFRKPFVVVNRHGGGKYSTNSRLQSLLNMLGLKNRMCGTIQQAEVCADSRIDYAPVEARLAEQAGRTRNYLADKLVR